MVVFSVPDHLTGDLRSHRGKFSALRHRSDLGEAHCIRCAINTNEDSERLAGDDLTRNLGPQGQGSNCRRPRQARPLAKLPIFRPRVVLIAKQ